MFCTILDFLEQNKTWVESIYEVGCSPAASDAQYWLAFLSHLTSKCLARGNEGLTAAIIWTLGKSMQSSCSHGTGREQEWKRLNKRLIQSQQPSRQNGIKNRELIIDERLNKKIGSLSTAADTFQPVIYFSQLQGPYKSTPIIYYSQLFTIYYSQLFTIIYYSQLQGPYNATPEPEDLAGTVQPEPWDLEQIFDRVILFAEKLSKRFKKPKKVVEEVAQPPSVKPGGEIAQELTDAWNLYTRVI